MAVAGRSASVHDRVKAVTPQAVVFLPLSDDVSQSSALVDDSLASRMPGSGGAILVGIGMLARNHRTVELGTALAALITNMRNMPATKIWLIVFLPMMLPPTAIETTWRAKILPQRTRNVPMERTGAFPSELAKELRLAQFEKRRHGFNAVPQILQSEVFVGSVLVIVVVGDGNHDGMSLRSPLHGNQRHASAHSWQKHDGASRTFDGADHLLRDRQVHRSAGGIVTRRVTHDFCDLGMRGQNLTRGLAVHHKISTGADVVDDALLLLLPVDAQ